MHVFLITTYHSLEKLAIENCENLTKNISDIITCEFEVHFVEIVLSRNWNAK